MTTKLCKALIISLCAFLISQNVHAVSAYYTGQAASVVIGQPDFTTNSSGTTSQKLNQPRFMSAGAGKFFVADETNSRVLIYNSLPLSTNQAADVVLGQPNFTSSTPNNGGLSSSSLASPRSAYTDGTKLYVVDQSNARVLIWNSIPTTNNQQADVVVGKPDFTTNGGATTQSGLSANVANVFTANGKLFVVDRGNNRVLIWNSIPTTNGVSADVVVGQPDFTTASSGLTAAKMNVPLGISVVNNKLIVVDGSNNRVLIWNAIPTTNGVSADVVLGQTSFTVNANGTSQTKLKAPRGVYSDGVRMFVADESNNRVMIWNSIPTSSGAAADLVLGQTDFISGNSGLTDQRLSGPFGITADSQRLYVAEQANNRITIFENNAQKPGLTVDSTTQSAENNQLRLNGSASTTLPYILRSVLYSVNGNGFSSATANDGSFDTAAENFSLTFDPAVNRQLDANGNAIDGFTVQLQATNNNADTVDHLFFFSPFVVNSPADGISVSDSYPIFDFSVNKHRVALKENLDHYAVQVRNRSNGSGWTTLIENIPVDFESRKSDQENVQRSQWESVSTLTGEYETGSFLAKYSENGSHISVKSKSVPLSGSYEWKVLAIDKTGHSQETGSRNLVAVGSTGSVTPGFPLAILNISGLGNPNISSYNLAGIKPSYRTSSTTPIFYGIAWSGSTIKLQLTQQNCTADCVHTYSASANALSRFGINVSPILKRATYTVQLSTQLNDLYTELPRFNLQVK